MLGLLAARLAFSSVHVPTSQNLVVGLKHSAAALAALDRTVAAVSTFGTPTYGHYVSPEQLDEMLRPSPNAVKAVRSWLGDVVGCALVDDGARFAHTLRCRLEPSYVATTRPPTPPHAVQLLLDFVVLEAPRRDAVGASLRSRLPAAFSSGVTPTQARAQYGLPEATRGGGVNSTTSQMVWGPGTFGFLRSDLSSFYTQYCPDCKVGSGDGTDLLSYDTANEGKPGGDNFDEGTLDATYISTFGKGVRTIVSNTNTSTATEEGEGQGIATLLFMEELVARPAATLPTVLSLSLGSLSSHACADLCAKVAQESSGSISPKSCHDFLQSKRQLCLYLNDQQTERINTQLKMLATRGVTVLSASGDGGSHFTFGKFNPLDGDIAIALNKVGCVQQSDLFPAASPWVLAIGGTMWPNGDPAAVEGWSDRSGASGGGFSEQWAMPSYQSAVVAAYLAKQSGKAGFAVQGTYNASNRAYPDVSAFMDGIPLCTNGHCSASISGGTSASTPTWGGIISLLNEARIANGGLPPLGLVGPRIWAMASAGHANEAFRDVTKGNTNCGCDNGYVASEGWDLMTGWGEPKWKGLLKYLGTDSE